MRHNWCSHPSGQKEKKTLKNFLVKFNKGDMQRPKSDFFCSWRSRILMKPKELCLETSGPHDFPFSQWDRAGFAGWAAENPCSAWNFSTCLNTLTTHHYLGPIEIQTRKVAVKSLSQTANLIFRQSESHSLSLTVYIVKRKNGDGFSNLRSPEISGKNTVKL